MKNNKTFTKQLYLAGLRCTKSLYLQTHMPELGEEDNSAQAIIDGGKEFELVVRELIAPGGLDLTFILDSQEERIARTSAELKKKNRILYQATFQNDNGELAMADIIIKKSEEIHLVEIKAVTQLTDIHYYDTSFQYHVITTSGFKIDKVSIAYINKEYIRGGSISPDLLIIEDITKSIKRIQSQIPKKIERFQKILNRKEAPSDNAIGQYCLNPHVCPFKNHCWDCLPTNNIFELRSMRISKKLNLHYKGITKMEDLINNSKANLSDGQIIQVTCALENKIVMQLDKLKDWLDPLQKIQGIFFLDFESVAPSVPFLKGTKAFSQICTQYSLHYKCKKSDKLLHMDFLADHGKDPREEFIKKLLFDLSLFDDTAPIVVFNKTFEATRLKELSLAFPQYEGEIKCILIRIVDIMDVFKNKWYYHPDFKGSYSIKAILPVMCPELSYKDLEVNNGAQASAVYLKLGSLPKDIAEKKKAALRYYCYTDTLAMVRLLEELEIIAYNNRKNFKIKSAKI